MRFTTRSTFAAAAAAALVLSSAGLAVASDVDVAVVDVTAPTNKVTVEAGGTPAPITITARVTGQQVGTATFELNRDWTLKGGVFTGSNPKEFTVGPRNNNDPANTFSTTGSVTVDPAQAIGDFNLEVGAFDITNSNTTGAKLAVGNAGNYMVTVTAPPPPPGPSNTAPRVTVTGFSDGDTFEIGSEPTPGCTVIDNEDTDEFAVPSVDRSDVDEHGLGNVTVTCSYEDSGGVSASDVASYTIEDTGKPTISHEISPATADGTNGWYKSAPTVVFSCSDTGSGVRSCGVDHTDPPSSSVTLGENATAQTVNATATDWAGNTATDSVGGLLVDLTDPIHVAFTGSINDGDHFVWGAVPKDVACTAYDAISGLADCTVTGWDDAVGTHTLTATATDDAGRTATASLSYTVDPWTLDGFYKPVDMARVVNTVKAGATVPLKFNVHKGQEKATSDIGATFSALPSNCDTGALTDAIEVTTTGSTSLRFDFTAQQWIQNWATPKSRAGTCYKVTMTTADGSSISADFKLK